MLLNNPRLRSLIDQLWDKFWSGGISNPLTAIEQITYLLFMKRLDDLDREREQVAKINGEPFNSMFAGVIEVPGQDKPVEKSALRWSHFRQMTADEMLPHVQLKVFPFLKKLNGKATPFAKHMENAVFIIPKASLLVDACNIIEDIYQAIEKDAEMGGHLFQDIQGDLYEYLLSEIASAGKNGQFRTPRHLIKFVCELAQPQLGNRIADPACGTGGFLLGAYEYILTQHTSPDKIRPDEDGFHRSRLGDRLDTKDREKLENHALTGYDIDQTMVRLGLMNLMMHGIRNPGLDYCDTLSKKFPESELGTYDIVLANPPFTGNVDTGDLFASHLNTSKTELLFLERIFQMLRPGGTAAVIVPQGVLFGSNKAFVATRRMLVEEAELRAVVALPGGVFKPYAGVATALLLFTKGSATENVWFAIVNHDGYSLDDKRTAQQGRSELPGLVETFRNRDPKRDTDRGQKYFFVPRTEIAENSFDISPSRYREEVLEQMQYDPPGEILQRLVTMEKEILGEMEKLAAVVK